MGFMIISISITVFLLTMVLFSNTIVKETHKKQQLGSMRQEIRYLDEELEKSFVQRFVTPIWKKMILKFSKVANKSQRKSTKKKKTSNVKLETKLNQAGIRMAAQEYQLLLVVISAVVLIGGVVAAIFISKDIKIRALIVLFALMVIIAVPRYVLSSKIKSRKLNIQNQMPNVMDVLSVSIEAGLGFDAALLRVVDKLKGPLVDELAQVYREIQMGRSRRDSLIALGKRNDVNELQMFASAVVQSEQFGTPIKNVLRSQSKQLRISRKQQAQEKGMKAPVKMMLPMVVFIFPVIFIILLGPTVINIVGQFR